MVGLKIPKLRFPKLDKRKRRFLIVALIALSFFIAGGIMFGTEVDRDIFDYGTATYQVKNKITGVLSPLTADSVVYADTSRLKISFTWTASNVPPAASDFHCVLRTSILDNIEDVYSTRSGDTYTFNYDLENVYQGTYTYYITLYAVTEFFYVGNSFTFTITKFTPQEIEPPTLDYKPDDVVGAPIDYAIPLSWGFTYNANCSVTLFQDGIEVDSRLFEKKFYSVYTQDYTYVFTPTEEGDYLFEWYLETDNLLHYLNDAVSVGAIIWEDYVLVDEIPSGFENVGVTMEGTLASIGLPLQHAWLIGSLVPADVHAYPKTGELTVKMAFTTATGTSIDILADTKLVMFDAAEERTEYEMTSVFVTEPILFGLLGRSYSSWKEVVIDLDEIPAGEYRCEIRTVYPPDNCIYKIAVFNLSVNTFPIGFVVTYGGIILLIGVLSIITIVALRRFRYWWGFHGKV